MKAIVTFLLCGVTEQNMQLKCHNTMQHFLIFVLKLLSSQGWEGEIFLKVCAFSAFEMLPDSVIIFSSQHQSWERLSPGRAGIYMPLTKALDCPNILSLFTCILRIRHQFKKKFFSFLLTCTLFAGKLLTYSTGDLAHNSQVRGFPGTQPSYMK